ncbi:MAG: D-alanyl-D-alanine carboxypeptidase/D-alanyl-D-alanine-endopeptidase [Gemmatimonadetes bacterium]|nr:D-alanyl-D-alanine carboxypeptidase/D-alanyl-D-alanine-endopeptidase [Gemmatimonadota bacterium]
MLLPLLVAAMLPLNAQAARAQFAELRAPTAAGHPVAKKKRAAARRASAAPASGGAIRYATPGSRTDLANDLGDMLGKAMRSGNWGVLVVSLTNGDTLFGRNPDAALLPASTMKLFTSAFALDRFGSSGRFETEVLRAGALGTDGVLRGDLVLRGAGDPTLGGKSAENGGEPPMVALARQIAASGVKRVSGGVVGDASAFDDRHVPDGWRKRYLGAAYAARVSALSFNENKITMVVRPDGGHASIGFEPAISGVPLNNEVKVVSGSRGGRIGVRQDSTGRFAVVGWIGAQSAPRDYQYVVEAPELFAAGALRAALAGAGVTVDGPVRLGVAPQGAVRIAAQASPTLDKIVTQMNGESNNHFAELLFRNAARSGGAAGSAESGNVLLHRFLTDKVNVPAEDVFAADGSGLSTLDRVTPRAMVHLLVYAKRTSWGPVFEASLPVAGRTETLKRRMKYTPAMGNLHAKTGTTNDVASLGGYVTAKNGEQLAFSFIYNGRDRWRAKEAMDAMGATLANFSR